MRLGGNPGGMRVYSARAMTQVKRGARRGGQSTNARRKLKYAVVAIAAVREQG